MNRLPDEILLLIVDNIVLFKHKYQFLQVCRRWRSVLFKAVYDYVWIEGHQIRPLLLAIQQNPAIGSSIKYFRLHWWSCYTWDKENHDITSVLPLVNRISQSEEETKEWEEALIEGNQDAWLGLLLLHMENMTSLLMHYTRQPKFLRRVISRAAIREKPFDTMPILQQLVDVGIDSSDDNKAWFHKTEFLPFFHLPALRSVSLDSVVESMGVQIDHPAFKPAKGTSPVVELEFGAHPNGSKGMADFITSCANLEKFKYQHSNQVIWGERYMNFRPRAFYSALLSSLKEILPSSLKWLCLSHYEDSLRDQVISNLLEVVACRKEKFPYLEEVEIQSYWQNTRESLSAKQAFTPLIQAGEDVGIDILVFPSFYRQRRA
ncbi:Fungal specific transcription factor domain family protein [Aspergillus niger]|uniref:Fungal specific transcription factor domain family protein n=1 Tax=Aspergillus niger TaxID=5061 RepID=A0A505IAH2_ASPNG|nr:Fungal specific transcription factor domain family protein [Aspergillus niger]